MFICESTASSQQIRMKVFRSPCFEFFFVWNFIEGSGQLKNRFIVKYVKSYRFMFLTYSLQHILSEVVIFSIAPIAIPYLIWIIPCCAIELSWPEVDDFRLHVHRFRHARDAPLAERVGHWLQNPVRASAIGMILSWHTYYQTYGRQHMQTMGAQGYVSLVPYQPRVRPAPWSAP